MKRRGNYEQSFTALAEQEWDVQQRQLAEEIINGPRGALLPPFEPLLRSPELMAHAQRMGEYLRYRSALGQRLSELAILLTARHWSQPVEWAIHAPIAREKGIAAAAVQAIKERRRPVDLRPDEQTVYDFVSSCINSKRSAMRPGNKPLSYGARRAWWI